MAAASIAKLAIFLTTDTNGMQVGFRRGEDILESFQGAVGRVQAAIAAMLAGAGSAGLIGWSVRLAADAEQARVSFEVMLGSLERANRMVADLREFAEVTPFEFTDLQDAAKTLLNFGIEGDKVLPLLQMLGDASGGNAQRFQQMALAFAQMSASGRLMGQDLLQMINAGFNPLLVISQQTGMSIGELKKQMEQGNISVEMVTEAFRVATSEGGLFFGMMDKQSQTLTGRWSTLQDQASELARGFGEFLAPAVGKLLDVGSGLLAWMQNVDIEGVKFATQMTVAAVTFTSVALVIPKVISALQALVVAYRNVAIAQAIVQALSGPRGWLVLGASVAAATVAVAGVTEMFNALSQKQGATAEKAQMVAESVTNQSTAFASLTKNADDAQKNLESLQKSGESLTKSLRNPMEIFKDSVAEANELIIAGAINLETYGRAIEKAADAYSNATKEKLAFEQSSSGIGAAERFTMSGFSAVQAGRRELQRQVELQQQQLKAQEENNRLTAEVLRAVERNEPRTPKVVTNL